MLHGELVDPPRLIRVRARARARARARVRVRVKVRVRVRARVRCCTVWRTASNWDSALCKRTSRLPAASGPAATPH